MDIDDRTCPCCWGQLHRIGEDVSERLDVIPTQFRVLVTRHRLLENLGASSKLFA